MDPEIVEAITEAGLGAQLKLLGYLPHPESVAELRQADIILLPLRHGPEYSKVYPGKIFECMAAVAHPSAPGKGQIRAPEKGAQYLHSPAAETPTQATAAAMLGIGPTDSAAAELLRATGTGIMFDWDADPSAFIRDAAAARLACNGRAMPVLGSPCGTQTGPLPAADGIAAASNYSRRALTARLATLLSSLSGG